MSHIGKALFLVALLVAPFSSVYADCLVSKKSATAATLKCTGASTIACASKALKVGKKKLGLSCTLSKLTINADKATSVTVVGAVAKKSITVDG
jgi:hypothetical protein